MKTRKQLELAIRESFEQQCRAHGLDSTDEAHRGVINNLLDWILAEWDQARRENAFGGKAGD